MTSFDEWKTLMQSEDDFDRSSAADDPPREGNEEEIRDLLIVALDDSEEMVRTCAADSLGYFLYPETILALRRALDKETYDVARNYIITSLGMVGGLLELSDLSMKLIATEKSSRDYGALAEAVLCLSTRLLPAVLVEVAVSGPKKSVGMQGLARSVDYLANALETSLEDARRLKDVAETGLEKASLQDSLKISVVRASV